MAKKQPTLNKSIWGDILFFEKNWNIIKNKKRAKEDEHPIKLTWSQWTSLAVYFDYKQKYGEKRVNSILKYEKSLISVDNKQLTVDGLIDIMYATKKPDKKLMAHWEGKLK